MNIRKCHFALYFILGTLFSCHAAFAQEKPTELYTIENPNDSGRFSISDNYVHEWLPFPQIEGESIFADRVISHRPRKGRSTVLVFLSSWCIPCQNLMPEFMDLYKRHSDVYSDIMFIFTSDTTRDAQGFAKEYNLDAPAIMANNEILAKFNQPESPTIFIGDRWGWMTKRIKNVNRQSIKEADQFLSLLSKS